MSQENVEIVRRLYEALNARQPEQIMGLVREDWEWIPNRADPAQKTRRGIEEALAAIEELWEAFDELTSEPAEFIDLGDRVLVVVNHTARGRGSQAITERQEVHLFTLEDELVTQLAEFPDRAEALEAVGLGE